jgi:hypothetical protein
MKVAYLIDITIPLNKNLQVMIFPKNVKLARFEVFRAMKIQVTVLLHGITTTTNHFSNWHKVRHLKVTVWDH